MSYNRKQPHRTCGKVGATLSAARRRAVIAATVARVNVGLVAVAGYLEQLGADAALVRRYASQLGKRAKQVCIAEQLPVLAKAARGYQRTADLFAGAR